MAARCSAVSFKYAHAQNSPKVFSSVLSMAETVASQRSPKLSTGSRIEGEFSSVLGSFSSSINTRPVSLCRHIGHDPALASQALRQPWQMMCLQGRRRGRPEERTPDVSLWLSSAGSKTRSQVEQSCGGSSWSGSAVGTVKRNLSVSPAISPDFIDSRVFFTHGRMSFRGWIMRKHTRSRTASWLISLGKVINRWSGADIFAALAGNCLS